MIEVVPKLYIKRDLLVSDHLEYPGRPQIIKTAEDKKVKV